MPELQSCPNSVNASALCARSRGCSLEFPASPLDYEEPQVKAEIVAQLSAELQRERQKNAALVEKVSLLEALIQKREENAIVPEVCPIATEGSFRKFKRQKIEPTSRAVEDREIIRGGNFTPETKHDILSIVPKDTNKQERLVNWMNIDDTGCHVSEKFKDEASAADCDDTDDSEDNESCDEDGAEVDDTNRKTDECSPVEDILGEESDGARKNTQYLENSLTSQSDLTVVNMNEGHNNMALLPDKSCNANKKDMKKRRIKAKGITRGCKEVFETHNHGQEVGHKGSGSISLHKKSPKVPFCPQEVKRIIESEVLLTKNAQSHTIRKIIVFASLGISHGCEDIYELDFNHFSILQKGEPYVSAKNPGEHVLYEHPGLRRKVFYPNRQNPTLCPVQILEEEKDMRPSDPTCPSCLFLCIKYGGSTRNLPQNEYVRQRMGRNKLKSFGPLMCKMALLVYIRSGSFFFKALGITLLFMAGFSDELVQRETKYRNLDLIQKYYRKDEDAAGDELFHSYPIPYDILAGKPTKSSCKKQIGSECKIPNTTSAVLPSIPSSYVSPTQFGLMGYASLHSHPMAASQSMVSSNVHNTPPVTNSTIATSSTSVPYHTGQIPSLYPMPPPHPANTFLPLMYWPHPNPFPSCPYPPSYAYRTFHPPGNYMSLHPPSYYRPPSHAPLMMTEVAEDSEKKHMTKGEVYSDSDSSSSSTKSKKS